MPFRRPVERLGPSARQRGRDRLVLRRAAHSIRFVHPPGYSYFAMLREKLSWSEAAEKGPDPD